MNQPRIFFYFRLFFFVFFLSFVSIHITYAGNYVTVKRGTAPIINWAVAGGATSCVGSTGYTYGTNIYNAWQGSTRNATDFATLPVANDVGTNWSFTCTAIGGVSDTAYLTVQDCSAYGETWNGTNACVPNPSASFTSTPSCTIPAGASSCISQISWTSANVTYASLTDSQNAFPQGLYGSYGPGAVTYNPGGTPPGVTIPYGGATYYIHNVTAGGTDISPPPGYLASVAGTATCTAGTSWNGSTCAVSACLGTAPTGANISSNGTATGPNQTWTYSAPGTSACTWVCNSGYHQNPPATGTSCLIDTTPTPASASFTSTPSCTIASGASTCQSPISWTSANVTYASLTDCGGGLYTSQGAGAVTYNTNGGVTVPYGSPNAGGCYQIRQDSSAGAVLATVYSTGTCTANTLWDGTKCTPTFYSCSGTIPPGSNSTVRNAITANGSWAYSASGECTWSCNSGYVKSGNSCIITSSNLPTGVIDSVSSGPIGTCGMASGWSYDADNTSAPTGIHIYVDGPAGSGTGHDAGPTTALRADVNAVFGITGNHGYNYPIPNLTVGNHTAYAYAIGIDTAGNLINESTSLTNNAINFNCSQATYTVTSSAGTGGSISPLGTQSVTSGNTTAFTVTPANGYSIASVSDTCGSGGGSGGTLFNNIYTTGPITANCTVTASFTANPTASFTSTPSCVISDGASNCKSPVSWTSANVTIYASLTDSGGYPNGLYGNYGAGPVTYSTNGGITIPYGSANYYIRNVSAGGADLGVLATTIGTANCNLSTSNWNGSICTPNACTNQTKTWLTNCSGSTGATTNGSQSVVTFTGGSYSGTATYSCNGATNAYTYVSGTCTAYSCSGTAPTGGNMSSNSVSTGVGQSWTYSAPGTSACTWVCNSGYHQNPPATGTSCLIDNPSAPTLSATASTCGNTWINLSWNKISTATTYTVYRGGNLLFTKDSTICDATTCRVSDTGLTLGSGPYSYTVEANNAGGSSLPSNVASASVASQCNCTGTAPSGSNFTSRPAITTNSDWAYSASGECTWSCDVGYWKNGTTCVIDLPATPINFSATASTCGKDWLNLKWDKVSTATTYAVYRDGVDAFGGPISGATYCGADNICRISDTGLPLGSGPYSYTIRAINAGGSSNLSSPITSETVAIACVCADPLTTEVTVACDSHLPENIYVSGDVKRTLIKSAYIDNPSCAFPVFPYTPSPYSVYKSNTCVYACNNGASNPYPGACNLFTVTPSSTGNGTITPNTPQTITSGNTKAFTVTPASGYVVAMSGTCGGNALSQTGGVYTTNAITNNCTVVATFTLGVCSPLTADVDVACDSISGTTYTGKLVRRVTKSSFLTGCLVPTATVNDPIVSNTCSYKCNNGSTRPLACLLPKVVNPVLFPNNDPKGKISFTCTDSDYYILTRDGTFVTAGLYTGPVIISLENFGSVAGNYLIKCFSGPDDTSVFDPVAVPQRYDPIPLSTDSLTLEATPVTIKSGTISTITWGINIPSQACDIIASPVCAGGSTCSGLRSTSASALTASLLTSYTDANDPYGANRLMTSALRNVVTGTKARGKKSIKIDYTTDFELNCHINIEGRPNPFKKLRVQVTNDNEG